jgi:Ca-activated chloride channel family protein
MTFSSRPDLRQDFTDDREKISQSLRRLNATGGTALYDAITEGLSKLRSGRHNKRALLVITDGQDTASFGKLDEVLQSIRESELLVYPIGISSLTYARAPGPIAAFLGRMSVGQARRDEVDLNVLHAFAENSGGRAFIVAESWISRGSQIERVLDTVADELRSQYTLGFYPSRPDDGRYHQLRVRTRSGNTVRARRGYIATRFGLLDRQTRNP